MVGYLVWLPCNEKAKGRPRFGLKLVLHRLLENHPPRTRPTATPNCKPASPLCFSHMHDAWPPMHGLQARVITPAASFYVFLFFLYVSFLFHFTLLASPLARFTAATRSPLLRSKPTNGHFRFSSHRRTCCLHRQPSHRHVLSRLQQEADPLARETLSGYSSPSHITVLPRPASLLQLVSCLFQPSFAKLH